LVAKSSRLLGDRADELGIRFAASVGTCSIEEVEDVEPRPSRPADLDLDTLIHEVRV